MLSVVDHVPSVHPDRLSSVKFCHVPPGAVKLRIRLRVPPELVKPTATTSVTLDFTQMFKEVFKAAALPYASWLYTAVSSGSWNDIASPAAKDDAAVVMV